MVGDNPGKPGLIPHKPAFVSECRESFRIPKEEPASD